MLPPLYIEELKAIPGFDIDAYLAALQLPPTRGLHLNLRKGNPKRAIEAVQMELGEQGIAPLPYAKDSFIYLGEHTVGSLPLHHAGAYYMQEPSAMCPIACLPLSEGMKVLDLCASPGGKSTQIANRIGESGLLVSNEINHSRCTVLGGNIERMGIPNAIVTNTDAQTLAAHLPAYFDAVVVDAPCSGEGMFRKMPDALAEWGADSPATCKVRQLDILHHAEKMLKKNGYLLYSTCTFSKAENEEVIREFVQDHPYFEILPVPEAVQQVTLPGIGDDSNLPLHYTRRFYPYVSQGEGQFMALLHKTEGEEAPKQAENKKAKKSQGKRQENAEDVKIAEAFAKECLTSFGQSIIPFKNGYSIVPAALAEVPFPLPTEYIYAFGTKIGEIRKGRVIPYHHFFTAYGKDFKTKLQLSVKDPLVLDYLRGEVIPTDQTNGWGVLMVEGYALGGVKISGGMAKNHYPAGLRNK